MRLLAIKCLIHFRQIILQYSKREFVNRYKKVAHRCVNGDVWYFLNEMFSFESLTGDYPAISSSYLPIVWFSILSEQFALFTIIFYFY